MIGFLTFEQFHGKKNIGSTRIRVDWLLKYWNLGDDLGLAERYQFGQKYDVIVYQKVYWPEHARQFKGIKILDMCDADWLDWHYKIVEMIQEVDAITCSTFEIAKFVANITDKPIWVIPDRIDFELFPKTKQHKGDLKKVAWFGYSENFEVLNGACRSIEKRGLQLIVVSNKSFIPPSSIKNLDLKNLPWSPNTWAGDLLKADVVINPLFQEGRFKYKSDNKTTQSWALGLPVVFTDKDFDVFASETARIEEATKRLAEVKEKYDVKDSVKELKQLITELKNDTANN